MCRQSWGRIISRKSNNWRRLLPVQNEKIPSLRACESYQRETRNRRIMMFLNYHGLEQLGQWILRVKSGIA